MTNALLIDASARAVAALGPVLRGLEHDDSVARATASAVARGHFTPDEDDVVRGWFARYLGVRDQLRETLGDLRPLALDTTGSIEESTRLRAFTVAYAAACALVRGARHLLEDVARHRLVQRKLNEPDERWGLPRKEYTKIYRSVTRPANLWRLSEARRFARAERSSLDALGDDPVMTPVLDVLRQAEPALDMSVGGAMRARLRYRWHSYRRRRASAAQRALFAIMEVGGRIIADIRSPWHTSRLDETARAEIGSLLEPGDVLVTRHHRVLSNVFLPGFWPHAALHIGRAADRERLGVAVDADRATRWVDPVRTLEARKDGVCFRALDDTLSVDAVAVLRPMLAPADICRAVARGVEHEGKLYDFDFDFFRSDRLVCTEVVYRAYQDVGGLHFGLTRRAGRPTLSAEDLISMALNDAGFQPVAVFGVDADLATGDRARQALARTRDA